MTLLSSTSTTASATTRICCICSSTTKYNNGSLSIIKPPRRRWRFQLHIISSSGDVSGETAPIEQADSSIETPKGPPSLISTLNVERALRGIPITDIDYYGVLGLQRRCSSVEVGVAYKNKVEQLLNVGLEEEQLNKEMEVLKESYRVLSSEKEKRLYDWSLVRSEEPDRYAWPSEVDTIKPSPEEPPPEEPEDVGPTRLVGYFIFAWFIISFILSVLLNLSK